MGQGIQIQLPADFAGQQAGIHACPCNRTIRNGNDIHPGTFEHPCTVHKLGQVDIRRRIQLHGNDLFALAQLFPEQTVRQGICRFHQRFFAYTRLTPGLPGQCCRCLCDMCRSGAAAAAQNDGAFVCHFLQLCCKIARITFIKRTVVNDHRITCIRHQRQGDITVIQSLHQLQHMPCAAYTVKANGIHSGTALHFLQQIGGKAAVTGKSIRLNGKGGDDISIRHLISDICRCFLQTICIGIGFQQEILCPQL